jgi:hypothetical protein
VTAALRKRADLVLSGGGIKGVALVGAVGALIDANVSPMTYAWKLRVKLRSTGVAALTGTEACLTVAQETRSASECNTLFAPG